jgi:DNA replication protein DnaC
VCGDTGWVYVEPALDNRAGCIRCECRQRKRLEARSAEIPNYYALYGEPRLGEIQPQCGRDSAIPSKGWHPEQARHLQRLRTDPARSWLLMGSNGTGKSFFGWALWWNAVTAGRPAVSYRLKEFVLEYRGWENNTDRAADRPASRPRLLPFDLRTKIKYTIFVDESDKLDRISPYVSQLFFDLVTNIRDYGHQLIMTTNLDWDGLSRMWSEQGEVYGASIMKRLSDVFERGIIQMFR